MVTISGHHVAHDMSFGCGGEPFLLSDFIRTYGTVGRPPNQFDECDSDETFYRLQRHRCLAQTQRTILPLWSEVKDTVLHAIKGRSDEHNPKEVSDVLRQMLEIGRECVGLGSPMDLVESAAVYILQVFHDARYLKDTLGVTSVQVQELSQMFGAEQINNQLINKAYECAKTVLDLLDTDERERLFVPFQTHSSYPRSSRRGVPSLPELLELLPDEHAWSGGRTKGMTIDPFEDRISAQICVTWDSIIEDSDSSLKNQNKAFDLSFQYKSQSSSQPTSSSVSAGGSGDSGCGEWLNKELNKYINRYNQQHSEPFYMTIETLVDTVVEWITADGKTDDELVADLHSLLGDECLQLIERVVHKRQSIKESFREMYSEPKVVSNEGQIPYTVLPRKRPLQKDGYREKRPAIAPSVVVHTEEEKHLKKQLLKMEKKMNKEMNKIHVNSGSNGVSYEDIERMKQVREQQLMSAMYGPLFKEDNVREVLDSIDYPYVFDSFVEAKSTPAFISGAKMTLPLGFVRNDQRRWEEITIPAPPPPPETVTNEFRLIDVEKELDEFGRIGFKGVKTLNRVQSIVFKTAFTTNENMLICAPTGAGKTNVAMLAILNEIRSSSPTGRVHDIALDTFKIVYIAPMKALAAEMTENFSKRLQPFGIRVRELTGDMQLTKNEIMNTQILVTTPEKWDVVTRKAKGDVQLLQLVRLIIIDEVHLLQSDRGPVLEALVARTKRYIESAQKFIRMVGLSATLPNYRDVAEFLTVSPKHGLFMFDNRFRPVPLTQTFIGCKATQTTQQMHDMDEVCYEKVHEMVAKGHQVMVFVHARNATHKTAMNMKERAGKSGHLNVFKCDIDKLIDSERMIRRARHKGLQELCEAGFAIHHAGMLRMDRNLVEKLFRAGVIKVLVCTATLAWGVNLPAHSVVIKGTEMYDASHGNFVDISMLDVMQIFGRAGRPQYDTEGHGTIITGHNKLRHYLSLLTNQYPIESNFRKYMTDNMNAEIVSGTITTIDEAVDWIRDTYLFIRMRKNPLVYGISAQDLQHDPDLFEFRRRLATESAEELDKAKMIRFSPETGTLDPTDLGRTASHFYIKYDTIEKFNEVISDTMTERDVFAMIATAQEFDQLKSREDEFEELEGLLHVDCRLGVPGGVESKNGKVNIIMQSYLSRARIESFSLVSDSMFVMQNVNRVARGLFEYVVKKGWALLAQKLLKFSLMFERQQWDCESPLRQFSEISYEVLDKIENQKLTLHKIRDLSADDVGRLVRFQKYGQTIKRLCDTLPRVEIEATIRPITRTVLMVQLEITPLFRWDDKYHGKVCETFWVWMFDIDSNHIYHSETLKLTKKQVQNKEVQKLTFNIPLLDPDCIPTQYIIHCSSDRWLGCSEDVPINCNKMILPEKYVPYTKLLDLDPLPVSALHNPLYESIYRFEHFNPIQTQIFHTLYHTDTNVLLGAPTGSGKTICAEIAMFRVFNTCPNGKIVYIAPLKALVRERVDDWKVKIQQNMGRNIVELTGDVTPDLRSIMAADVIVTTPEKWDGVSRGWQSRKYVREVALIVIDEIHLLGEDRGPVLEVIVSRTNFIREKTSNKIRIIGLSTAIANAQDLANWLDIKNYGLYNFKPSVRPVPIEVHVNGYPGKNYCPRMALMNKPAYRAILQHSPEKPVLVFVSSRRQTRLTAFDFMSFLAADNNPYRFLRMDREEMTALIQNVRDTNLQTVLLFGIGLHHAGLHERDRTLVEELFSNQKIQVLITTATLAWGVNLPAHAVVIKGTEYFDGKKHKYVDFPITDVLQMMGRAGRPQFDTTGVAVVLVHDIKKEFYKKFLYEPFPVESSLLSVMSSHLNAEIVSQTVCTKQEALEYLNWTYLFRRVLKNPNYYGLESTDPKDVNIFLSQVIDTVIQTLVNDWCIAIEEDERTLTSTPLGRIASYYYLHHSTLRHFWSSLSDPNVDTDFPSLLNVLTNAYEYNELPVRHNEDILNGELANSCPIKVGRISLDSPHTKANLLLQAHISRLSLPNTDYFTDLKSVLDQAIRILQAMIDVSSLAGALTTTLRIITLMQMIVQCRWHTDHPLLTLPELNEDLVCRLPQHLSSLPLLVSTAMTGGIDGLTACLKQYIGDSFVIQRAYDILRRLPLIECSLSLMRGELSDKREASGSSHAIPVPVSCSFDPSLNQYIPLEANTEYTLICRLTRVSDHSRRNQRPDGRAVAPKFPKPKDENWFLVLGDTDKQEVIAVKRVGSVVGKSVENLVFTSPSAATTAHYTLYLCSDSYLNLDQQFNIWLNVDQNSN